MDEDKSRPLNLHLTSHLSNERTHLSYLRTSLSMISFGVTLNRISVYLASTNSPNLNNDIAVLKHMGIFGLGIVILGLLLLFWSVYRYHQIYKDIQNGTFKDPFHSVVIMTIIVIFLSGVVTYWLLSTDGI